MMMVRAASQKLYPTTTTTTTTTTYPGVPKIPWSESGDSTLVAKPKSANLIECTVSESVSSRFSVCMREEREGGEWMVG